jgi:16S rRNA (uracil1498-N3)-methyltransferase
VTPALRTSAAHVFVGSLEAPQLEPDDAHHLFRVLRLRAGEVVTVSDGAGGWRTTEVRDGSLHPLGGVHHEPRPPALVIATAIPKGDRLEWMVQKLTELGVAEVVFLHCARSAVRWDGDRRIKQLARLGRVAREASMQSRRTWLPILRGPVAFADVADLPGTVLAEPTGSPADEPFTTRPRCVVIGPEGGFTPEELASAAPRVRLGDTILRVETAAIVSAIKFS